MISVYYHKEAGLDCLHLYKLVISMWWRDHAQIHGSCNISDVLMKLHCWNNQEGMFVCYERCTNPTWYSCSKKSNVQTQSYSDWPFLLKMPQSYNNDNAKDYLIIRSFYRGKSALVASIIYTNMLSCQSMILVWVKWTNWPQLYFMQFITYPRSGR